MKRFCIVGSSTGSPYVILPTERSGVGTFATEEEAQEALQKVLSVKPLDPLRGEAERQLAAKVAAERMKRNAALTAGLKKGRRP